MHFTITNNNGKVDKVLNGRFNKKGALFFYFRKNTYVCNIITCLFYFALKFVKSHEFAEDIFQDAFTVVWQTRRFINPEASFSSYLYTIVRNRILNQLRDMANEDQLKEQILSQAIDSANETNNHILLNDLKEIIARALEQLTPRQREVFKMSRELQMSHKEIAEALGVSVHTVQEHISLSLKVIRSYLTKYSSTSADVLLILLCLNL